MCLRILLFGLHLTLIPYLAAAGELKTKPTQHSVKQLLELGIQPDILVCRTEHHLNKEIKEKAEVIEKYEKIIIELKEKQFRNMLNIEKYNNVKNVIQKFILLNPSDFIYFIQLVRGLCEILEIPISIKKS